MGLWRVWCQLAPAVRVILRNRTSSLTMFGDFVRAVDLAPLLWRHKRVKRQSPSNSLVSKAPSCSGFIRRIRLGPPGRVQPSPIHISPVGILHGANSQRAKGRGRRRNRLVVAYAYCHLLYLGPKACCRVSGGRRVRHPYSFKRKPAQ